MKSIMWIAGFAVSLAAGSYAVAQQDQGSQPTQPTQSSQTSQSMNNSDSTSNSFKDCMARQKASNSGLTELQMKTTCKNEVKAGKARKSGNDLATGTQSGSKPQ